MRELRELRELRRTVLISGSGLEGHTVSGLEGYTVSGLEGHTVSGLEGHTVSGLEGYTVSGLEGHTVSGLEGHTVSALEGHTVSLLEGRTGSVACQSVVPNMHVELLSCPCRMVDDEDRVFCLNALRSSGPQMRGIPRPGASENLEPNLPDVENVPSDDEPSDIPAWGDLFPDKMRTCQMYLLKGLEGVIRHLLLLLMILILRLRVEKLLRNLVFLLIL